MGSIEWWGAAVRPLSQSVAQRAIESEAAHTSHTGTRPSKLPQRSQLLWVGVDLDGTLASPVWTPANPTSEIGDPIWSNVDKVKKLVADGYKIIIHTSRGWTDYEAIENWLIHYGIPFKEIQCGKPLYKAYIDDRAINAADEDWTPRVH